MKPSPRLLQHACRITLFKRGHCGLCDRAKNVLSIVWDRRPFEYQELDLMASENKRWKDLYEFDAPVVYVQPTSAKLESATKTQKLMHRFQACHVEKIMDDVEGQS